MLNNILKIIDTQGIFTCIYTKHILLVRKYFLPYRDDKEGLTSLEFICTRKYIIYNQISFKK